MVFKKLDFFFCRLASPGYPFEANIIGDFLDYLIGLGAAKMKQENEDNRMIEYIENQSSILSRQERSTFLFND